jgi:hypothetical protein
MLIIKGNYKKKDNTIRQVELLQVLRTPEAIEGIDLSKLLPEEREAVIKITKDFENNIKQYQNKAWRKLFPGSFIGNPETREI